MRCTWMSCSDARRGKKRPSRRRWRRTRSSPARRRSVGGHREGRGRERTRSTCRTRSSRTAPASTAACSARHARCCAEAAERTKPNDDRLREYRDTALPRIEQQLGANVPIYPELEQLTLSFSLERMREWLGPDDPTVRQLLGKESPDQLAKRLISRLEARRSGGAHGAVEGRRESRGRQRRPDDRAREGGRRARARGAQEIRG